MLSSYRETVSHYHFASNRYNGTDSALMTLQPAPGTDFAAAFAQSYKVSLCP